MDAVDAISKQHGPTAFMCLALVKPASALAREWRLTKPSYCIFDFDPAFGYVEIRWGDGSSQRLTRASDLDALILLRQFGEKEIEQLFD